MLTYDETEKYKTVQAMLQPLARKMTGKSVYVKVEYIFYKDVKGRTERDRAGDIHILLDPSNDIDNMFVTFLHEVSHVILHAAQIATPQEWEAIQDETARAEILKNVRPPAEIQADSLADAMNKRTAKKAMALFGASDGFAKFLTLDRYYQEIQNGQS